MAVVTLNKDTCNFKDRAYFRLINGERDHATYNRRISEELFSELISVSDSVGEKTWATSKTDNGIDIDFLIEIDEKQFNDVLSAHGLGNEFHLPT